MGRYEDPGWGDAIKRLWAFPLIPFLIARRRLPQVALLIGVRRVFLAMVASMFSILIVLAVMPIPWSFGDAPTWAPLLIIAMAAYGTGVTVWVRARDLPCSSEEKLAGAWAGAFFISIGVSQSVALMGFVLSFIADGKAWYPVGLVVTLSLLAVNAPTRGAIERKQRQLDAQGCSMQLGEALVKPRSTGQT